LSIIYLFFPSWKRKKRKKKKERKGIESPRLVCSYKVGAEAPVGARGGKRGKGKRKERKKKKKR